MKITHKGKSILCLLGFLAILSFPLIHLNAQDLESRFERFTFQGSSTTNLQYRLHTPDIESTEQLAPLIIYLHGSGGWGQDNEAQLRGGNRYGAGLWLRDDIAESYPAYILAPQLPPQERWAAPSSAALTPHTTVLLELIDALENSYQIDTRRIYLIGQSLGGAGVWDLVSKVPDRFAAAVPICGFGDKDRVSKAQNVLIWAFHGALDTTVAVERSRELVSALRSIDGNVTYTEYPEVAHNSWIQAFSEPDLPEWLFAQSID